MTEDRPFFEIARHYLSNTLTLPERTIRSLTALAGEASTLLTDTLLPGSLRGTMTYRVVIGMMQRFHHRASGRHGT